MRKQREMEYHWGLEEGSAHLRQGWLRVCVCVCVCVYLPLKCFTVGKRRGLFLHNGEGFCFLHFSVFLVYTKCSRIKNLFCCFLF